MSRTITHDGRVMRPTTKWAWRSANPEMDVDAHGSTIDDKYFVIVEMSKCPLITMDNGDVCYNPLKVKQAFKLAYGGPNYGYKCVQRTAKYPMQFRNKGAEWVLLNAGDMYVDVQKYLIDHGSVYTTSFKRLPNKRELESLQVKEQVKVK